MCLNNNYPSNAVISYCLNALKGPSNPTPYMTCVGLSNPPKKRKVACIPGTQMTLVLVGKGLLFGGLKPKNWYLPAKTQQKKNENWRWVFRKIRVPQNGWFIMENPIKMDDLEGKPTIFGNIQMFLWNSSHSVHLSMAPPIAERTLESSLDEKLNEWKLGGDASSGCGEGKVAMDGSTTVDGWNPAPPRMMIIPLFIGFHTSQVVQDFFHQQ